VRCGVRPDAAQAALLDRLGLDVTIRIRVAIELAVLAVATTLYLVVLSERPMALDVASALVGLGLVAASARHTRERVWGSTSVPRRDRLRRAGRSMLALTALALLLLAAWGSVIAWQLEADGRAILGRLLGPTFLALLPVYAVWALAQQALFQFYLLGRVRALVPSVPPVALSIVNGVLFGAVHLPDAQVVALTTIGGAIWSYVYQRDRVLWPLALSHAVLGAAFYQWVRGRHLILDWLSAL
jgi:membrane protease YdiL (CAAX protease family)